MRPLRLILTAIAVLSATGIARAETPTRLRGTITSVVGPIVHVLPTQGGDVALTLADDAKVTLMARATLADVKPGNFIGTAATTQSDGTLIRARFMCFPKACAARERVIARSILGRRAR